MANSRFQFLSQAVALDSSLNLRRAGPADLQTIMSLERGAGFEAYVGRSSFLEHQEMLASSQFAYFLGVDDAGTTVAFAILRDLDEPNGNLYLKRIAVDEPGRGEGTRFLASLIDWAFAHTAAHRIYLDCFVENLRAQRAYAKLGFTRDGVLRQAYLGPDGRRRDLTLMALTRPEWTAGQREA